MLVLLVLATFGRSQALEKHDVIVFKKKEVYAAFPNMFKNADGSIVASFMTKTTSSHVDHAGGSRSVVSRDNGKTWQEYGKGINPSFVAADGSIVIPFAAGWREIPARQVTELSKKGVQVRQANGRSFAATGAKTKTSRDNGKTWSLKDLDIPAHNILMGYNDSSYLRTSRGIRILAVYGKFKEEEKYQVFLIRSVDDGKNWKFQRMLLSSGDAKIGFGETALVEAGNGTILAMMRPDPDSIGFLHSSTSDDGGSTWSTPKRTDIWGYPANLLKLDDNRILCSYGYRRFPKGVRASILNTDFTSRVGDELVIRADGKGKSSDMGYPLAVQLDHNKVLIIYYMTAADATTHIASTTVNLPK